MPEKQIVMQDPPELAKATSQYWNEADQRDPAKVYRLGITGSVGYGKPYTWEILGALQGLAHVVRRRA